MKLENQEIFEEYYEKHSSQFPGIPKEQVKEACYGSWIFLKKEMESSELPNIRLKYFGTFRVYKSKVIKMLSVMKERFKNKKIDPKNYFRVKKMLEIYLSKCDDKTK